MKIIYENNMCYIYGLLLMFTLLGQVCVNLYFYMISASFYASFYPNKREKCCDLFTPGHIDKKVWHNIH